MATRPLRGLFVGMAMAVCVAGAAPALAAPAPAACGNESPTNDCGGAEADATCNDLNGAPDPLQDCADLGDGTCGCRPRVCCDCDTATDAQISACNLPCTQTGIGLLACVSICALIDASGVETCELNIVNRSLCEGDSCPTTGCCTFNESSNARTVSQNICVETDADTCNLLGGLVVFTEGGSCVGGMFGTCTAPTPTSTPTQTGTATVTNTPTWTPTASNTPTNTLVPEGGDCTTPSECETGFCVDDVCCNSACDGPFDICNDPANPGECTAVTAQAPAMSSNGLLIAFLVLIGVAGLTLLYRSRKA